MKEPFGLSCRWYRGDQELGMDLAIDSPREEAVLEPAGSMLDASVPLAVRQL